MKKLIYILTVMSTVLMSFGCSERFEHDYDSLYYMGPDTTEYCHMPLKYSLSSSSGKLPVLVTYSGSWDASLDSLTDWAFLDRKSGDGIGYIRMFYTSNPDTLRTTAITLVCDNGDEAQIIVEQKGK